MLCHLKHLMAKFGNLGNMTQDLYPLSLKVTSRPYTRQEVDQKVYNFLLINISNIFIKHDVKHSVNITSQVIRMELLLKELMMCLGRLSAKTMTPGLENNLHRPYLLHTMWHGEPRQSQAPPAWAPPPWLLSCNPAAIE